MSDDKSEAEIRKGKQAAILLDDPVLNEAVNSLEHLAIEAMLSCSADELLQRRAEVDAIRKFRRALKAYVTNGRLAERTIAK